LSSDAFDVRIDQMLKHATTVANLASDARNAASTAQAALSGDSFGVIGQFLAALLLQATGEAKEGLNKAAQTITDVNTGLLTTAKTYQDTDRRHALRLDGILKEAE
jgi:excreted virulence factor EspC (type VII ESX diderm)